MMKIRKAISLTLALLLLLGASSCFGKDDDEGNTPPNSGQSVISPGDTDEETGKLPMDDDDISHDISQDGNSSDIEGNVENNGINKPNIDNTNNGTSTSKPRPGTTKPSPPEDENTGDGGNTEDDDPETPGGSSEEVFISDEIYFQDYFQPSIRFIVASDVHFDDAGSEVQEGRLKEMFDVAYEYAASEEYPSLDGAFIAGDFTNRGTEISVQKFFDALNTHAKDETITHASLGNHEYGAGDATHERYLRISGYKNIHEHLIINGYHFIFLSPDKNSGHNFSEDARNWLSEQLEIASLDDKSGEKPIFVFQHEHIKGTVYGSTDWGVADLTDILEKYPQIIDFSGHSHYPMNDPRSIWQGTFTALGTSTLSYYEMDITTFRSTGIFHSDYEGGYSHSPQLFDAAQFYIVEVDQNNAVKIMGYDLTADRFMQDVTYLIRTVGHPEEFKYTDERKTNSPVPYFRENSLVYAEIITQSSAKIRFEQAVCEDDIQNYIVDLYKDDKLISSQRRLSCAFMDPIPDEIAVTFTSLEPESSYKAKITAVSSWEKYSEPITFDFTTLQKPEDSREIFSLGLESGYALNSSDGTILRQINSPLIAKDEKGRNYAEFNGKNAFVWDDVDKFYEKTDDSVTFECVMNLNSFIPAGNTLYTNPLSNQESGGFGLEFTILGKAQFLVYINGKYHYAESRYPIALNEEVYLAGTYDGKMIRLYVNGVLDSEISAPGTVAYTSNETATHLAIGADSASGGGIQGGMTGKIYHANVFDSALSAEEIFARYNSLTN